MANLTTGLGYGGSEKLTRTPKGIINIGYENEFPIVPFFNYPVVISFSGRAIKKMDFEYRQYDSYPTIDISGNFASGVKVNLFSINTIFFGRVQSDKTLADHAFKLYIANQFDYDPMQDQYECDDHQERCSPGNVSENKKIKSNDILKSFSATYLAGSPVIPKKHEFTQKDVVVETEKLLLEIDTDKCNDWVLNLTQHIQKTN